MDSKSSGTSRFWVEPDSDVARVEKLIDNYVSKYDDQKTTDDVKVRLLNSIKEEFKKLNKDEQSVIRGEIAAKLNGFSSRAERWARNGGQAVFFGAAAPVVDAYVFGNSLTIGRAIGDVVAGGCFGPFFNNVRVNLEVRSDPEILRQLRPFLHLREELGFSKMGVEHFLQGRSEGDQNGGIRRRRSGRS